MTIFKHELRQNRIQLLIWTLAVGLMGFICIIMFTEMKGMTAELNDMFSSMGAFTEAFGMDRLNIGTIMGFYGIECANILGIGGAFFAGLLGVGILAKEEGEHTAEFLLTHPVSRMKVLVQKFAAVVLQILIFNAFFIVCSIIGIAIVQEPIEWKEFLLFHLAETIMQLEILCICFGISAFLKRNNFGLGLGLAALFYFVNIFANLSEKAEFAKYLTPFSYTEASDIFTTAKLEWKYIIVGLIVTAIGIICGFIKYNKKDIAS